MFASLHPGKCPQSRDRARLKLKRTPDCGFSTEVVTRISGLARLPHICLSKRDIPLTLLRCTVDLRLGGANGMVGWSISYGSRQGGYRRRCPRTELRSVHAHCQTDENQSCCDCGCCHYQFSHFHDLNSTE